MRIKLKNTPEAQRIAEKKRFEKKQEKPLDFEKQKDLVKSGVQSTLMVSEINKDENLVEKFDKIYG